VEGFNIWQQLNGLVRQTLLQGSKYCREDAASS